MSERVGVGLVGGGMMGRELAATLGRWPALSDHPVTPELVAVCDTNSEALAWFERVASVRLRTADYRELLREDGIDVLYLAVPHHLHEQLYLDTIEAGRDFLGEKPFGIDLSAAERIVAALREHPDVFARCSSEMPFFPGAQLVLRAIASGALGQPIEAEASFLHSSDLDRAKPINWKRQARFCGEIGVMGDLGMHVVHPILRAGFSPSSVFSVLQDIVTERPGPDGAPLRCDTIDNATLIADAGFPIVLRTHRIAPGEMNTWRLRAVGMDGGVEFSTAKPKTVWRFAAHEGRQVWEREQVGSQSVFATVTGAIFEFGFSDAILQMWAAFLAERAGALGTRFGCATPEEALTAHRLADAALRSRDSRRAEPVGGA